jgi:hypothetical protein
MYRSKIEVMFLALKHLLGAFAYHFWTRALPKAKTHADPLPVEEQREKAAAALEAIERFVNLAAIALGLLQYLALTFDSKVWSADKGWMRTCSSDIPSEKIVQDALRMQFFSSIGKVPDCLTLQVIKEKSRLSLWEETG